MALKAEGSVSHIRQPPIAIVAFSYITTIVVFQEGSKVKSGEEVAIENLEVIGSTAGYEVQTS